MVVPCLSLACRARRRARIVAAWVVAAALSALSVTGAPAAATPAPVAPAATVASGPAPTPASLTFMNRTLHTMRVDFEGATPAQRAQRARARLSDLPPGALGTAPRIERIDWNGQPGRMLLIGDTVAFTVLQGDLLAEDGLDLEAATAVAAARLREALAARRELRDPRAVARGAAWVTAGTAVFGGVLATIAWGVGRVFRPLRRRLAREAAAHPILGIDWSRHASRLLLRVTQAIAWLLAAFAAASWLAFSLRQFAASAPLSDRLEGVVFDLLWAVGRAVVAAGPGLAMVVVVAIVARLLHGAIRAFFDRVESGELLIPGLHADTASATRRIAYAVLWTLAVIAAYPYVPGSQSEVFRGVSVLIGFLLTLGSSGVASQLMSGLVLVYARSLRPGDFVSVGDVEGVVREIGVLAVKVVNMRNEEITIPNGVVVSTSVKNFSKLSGSEGTLLSTRVTIGYDAPWREVHAMLQAAAAATPGIRAEPRPFVYQRALQDFYVEYELFAFIDEPLRRLALLSTLHANIQDEFNRHGVQIMSPHFLAQPDTPVVVPPARWGAAAEAGTPPTRPPFGESA